MIAKVEQKWGFGMAPIKIDVQQVEKVFLFFQLPRPNKLV